MLQKSYQSPPGSWMLWPWRQNAKHFQTRMEKYLFIPQNRIQLVTRGVLSKAPEPVNLVFMTHFIFR